MDPEPTFVFQLLGIFAWVVAVILIVVKPPRLELAVAGIAAGLGLFFFPTLWNTGEAL